MYIGDAKCLDGVVGLLARLRERSSTIVDLWGLLRERKRWWLFPLILLFMAVGAILFLVSQSPVAPFIYTVF